MWKWEDRIFPLFCSLLHCCQHKTRSIQCGEMRYTSQRRELGSIQQLEKKGTPSYSSLRMWAQRADAWAYSADLPHEECGLSDSISWREKAKSIHRLCARHCRLHQHLRKHGTPPRQQLSVNVGSVTRPAGEKRPQVSIRTPPASEETWDSTQKLSVYVGSVTKRNASTHSADLPHHDNKSKALLAKARPSRSNFGNNRCRPAKNSQFCTMSRFENIDGHSRTQKKNQINRWIKTNQFGTANVNATESPGRPRHCHWAVVLVMVLLNSTLYTFTYQYTTIRLPLVTSR
jgi:hypothetical protein